MQSRVRRVWGRGLTVISGLLLFGSWVTERASVAASDQLIARLEQISLLASSEVGQLLQANIWWSTERLRTPPDDVNLLNASGAAGKVSLHILRLYEAALRDESAAPRPRELELASAEEAIQAAQKRGDLTSTLRLSEAARERYSRGAEDATGLVISKHQEAIQASEVANLVFNGFYVLGAIVGGLAFLLSPLE